jgi:hypothetical protein
MKPARALSDLYRLARSSTTVRIWIGILLVGATFAAAGS